MPDIPTFSAKSIFLCYRREDSEEIVDRIYETLAEHFSEEALFRDIDDIPPGSKFPAVIQQRLHHCDVVLVFIGREWVKIEPGGHRRLDDPNDPLRIEVQTALALPHALVIPVLVKKAMMPKVDELPASLGQLLELNAFTIRSAGPDYKKDMTEFVEKVRQGIVTCVEKRAAAAAAEREKVRRQEWATQGKGPLPQPLDQNQWERLLDAIEAGTVAVVCGFELGTDPKVGEPVSREHSLAVAVANTLGLPVPPLEARRPLAQLAVRCQQEGRREEFAHALRRAADTLAPSPATSLLVLRNIEPLRLFLTSALDRELEAALGPRRVDSIAYTRSEPFGLDNIDRTLATALVYHVAGSAGGLPGDAIVTDADWRHFASAWRERQPRKLPELFEGQHLLFLGGGHPAGFVEFWIECAARLHCLTFWIGFSTFAHDPTLAGFLREGAGRQQILFDDSGEDTFLAELDLRWARRKAAKSRTIAEQAGRPTTGRSLSDRTSVALDREWGEFQQARECPWPGLAPFSEQEHRDLAGREEEISLLVQALSFDPVAVLFAASGMGKTSLVRAGVVPKLRAKGVVPVPLRIDWGPDAKPFRGQVLQAVVAEGSRASIALPDSESAASLWEFFHGRNIAQSSGRFALLFDQFEEFFSVDGTTPDTGARALAGWKELVDLVENRVPSSVRHLFGTDASAVSRYNLDSPAPHVLLSLREEFLPQMDSLSRDMPSLNKNRVRLLGLSREKAKAVVLQTGHGIFTEEAADVLIQSLIPGSRDSIGASEHLFESARVPPAILGLLCLELNEKRLELGLPQVDVSLVHQTAGKLLELFYEDAFHDFSSSLRHWVEDELVTGSEKRDCISQLRAERDLANRGVPSAAIDALVERRLLSISAIDGIRCVHLAHDLLLPIVLESRDSRACRSCNASSAEKNRNLPESKASSRNVKNSRRNRRDSTRTGKKKRGRQEIHRAPSREIPPPGTIQWRWG